MSKGRDATTITDSTGRRRLTKLWDGGSRRALRAPSRGAGRHAAPSSGLRRFDGVLVMRSCAWPLAAARAPLPRRPPPASVAARVGGAAPTGQARRGPSVHGPATRRWASRRSTRTAGADERAARGREPPPRHRSDTASARRRASRPTHTQEREEVREATAPRPAQWTSTAR